MHAARLQQQLWLLSMLTPVLSMHSTNLQAAVDFRERWAALPQSNIIPEQLGGDAALARAESIEAVAPYVPDLHSLTVTHAQLIYSAATRAVPAVEPGSFAELALAVSIQQQQQLLVASQQQSQQQQQVLHYIVTSLSCERPPTIS
jgi:hypothetical protein